MKTQRNHRKTTTSRRRRHVKHRVQTRIHYRKGTVSSGRRHKFFKRGGAASLDDIINTFIVGIEPSVEATIRYGKINLTVERIYAAPVNLQATGDPPDLIINIDNIKIKFVTLAPTIKSQSQSVYIYYHDGKLEYTIYGRIMLVVNNAHHGSYFTDVAKAIFDALKQYKQYKQKQ